MSAVSINSNNDKAIAGLSNQLGVLILDIQNGAVLYSAVFSNFAFGNTVNENGVLFDP